MFLAKTLRSLIFLAALLVFGSASAYAQGSCTLCTSVSSTLTLTATVETSILLNISTGTGGATVTDGGSGAFSVPFGNVNGLGVGTPAAGVSVSTSGSGATYTTPIFVTPNFSGFSNSTATVKVYQDSATSAASQSAARGGRQCRVSANHSGICKYRDCDGGQYLRPCALRRRLCQQRQRRQRRLRHTVAQVHLSGDRQLEPPHLIIMIATATLDHSEGWTRCRLEMCCDS